MKGFLRLEERTATVTIRGMEFTARALNMSDIKRLARRYPELDFMSEQTGWLLQSLYSASPEALGAFVAAGLGYAGDVEQERAAMRLSAMEQIDVVNIVLELSLGDRATTPDALEDAMMRH